MEKYDYSKISLLTDPEFDAKHIQGLILNDPDIRAMMKTRILDDQKNIKRGHVRSEFDIPLGPYRVSNNEPIEDEIYCGIEIRRRGSKGKFFCAKKATTRGKSGCFTCSNHESRISSYIKGL